MNEKDYEILLMLDQERNMTRAAEKLYISQPNLTYRLRQIEDYFQTEIFLRDRSGLIPTPQGELILELAKKNMMNINETIKEIELIEESVQGTIKLGVASTFGQYILPHILKDFNEIYPKVEFNIVTGISSEISKLLLNGDVHIAIFRGDFIWEEEQQVLTTEPICVISKNKVQLSCLPKIPRIEYNMDDYLKSMVKDWWKENFKEPGFATTRVDSLETAKEMVRAGLGYAIVPGICLLIEKELVIQKIYNSNNEMITRTTVAYCRNHTLKIPAVKQFYEFIKIHPSYSKTLSPSNMR